MRGRALRRACARRWTLAQGRPEQDRCQLFRRRRIFLPLQDEVAAALSSRDVVAYEDLAECPALWAKLG